MDLEINKLEYVDDTLMVLEIDYILPIYFTNSDTEEKKSLKDYSHYKMENIVLKMKKNSTNNFFMIPKSELKKVRVLLSEKYSVDLNKIVFVSPAPLQEYITNVDDDSKEPEVNFYVYYYIEFQGANMLQHMRKNKIKNILERD